MSNIVYKKVFTEFRYPGQIEILDGRAKIVKQYYPDYFPHWTIQNESSIKLHTVTPIDKSLESILIEHKRFAYTVENPSTDNYFTDKSLKYFKPLLDLSSIPIISRIGIRSYIFFGPIDFDKYMEKTQESELVFSNDFNQLNKSIGGYSDIMVTLTGPNSRVVYGPIKKGEKNIYTEEIVEKDKIDDSFCFIDIDNSVNNVPLKDYKKIFSSLFEKQKSSITLIQKYFMEKCNG